MFKSIKNAKTARTMSSPKRSLAPTPSFTVSKPCQASSNLSVDNLGQLLRQIRNSMQLRAGHAYKSPGVSGPEKKLKNNAILIRPTGPPILDYQTLPLAWGSY